MTDAATSDTPSPSTTASTPDTHTSSEGQSQRRDRAVTSNHTEGAALPEPQGPAFISMSPDFSNDTVAALAAVFANDDEEMSASDTPSIPPVGTSVEITKQSRETMRRGDGAGALSPIVLAAQAARSLADAPEPSPAAPTQTSVLPTEEASVEVVVADEAPGLDPDNASETAEPVCAPASAADHTEKTAAPAGASGKQQHSSDVPLPLDRRIAIVAAGLEAPERAPDATETAAPPNETARNLKRVAEILPEPQDAAAALNRDELRNLRDRLQSRVAHQTDDAGRMIGAIRPTPHHLLDTEQPQDAHPKPTAQPQHETEAPAPRHPPHPPQPPQLSRALTEARTTVPEAYRQPNVVRHWAEEGAAPPRQPVGLGERFYEWVSQFMPSGDRSAMPFMFGFAAATALTVGAWFVAGAPDRTAWPGGAIASTAQGPVSTGGLVGAANLQATSAGAAQTQQAAALLDLEPAFRVETVSPSGRAAEGIGIDQAILSATTLSGTDDDLAERRFWLRHAVALMTADPRLAPVLRELGKTYAQDQRELGNDRRARALWQLAAARGDRRALCLLAEAMRKAAGRAGTAGGLASAEAYQLRAGPRANCAE